jgi:hypothetical protein
VCPYVTVTVGVGVVVVVVVMFIMSFALPQQAEVAVSRAQHHRWVGRFFHRHGLSGGLSLQFTSIREYTVSTMYVIVCVP